MVEKIDEAEFKRRFGIPPINDDLERVNCVHAGDIGHFACGVCKACSKPVFLCGHFQVSLPKDSNT